MTVKKYTKNIEIFGTVLYNYNNGDLLQADLIVSLDKEIIILMQLSAKGGRKEEANGGY